jgi:hypothetical protein
VHLIEFPLVWRLNRSTFSANLELIWEMSINTGASEQGEPMTTPPISLNTARHTWQLKARVGRKRHALIGHEIQSSECPLWVNFGLSRPTAATSAFGGKADEIGTKADEGLECPLLGEVQTYWRHGRRVRC